MNFGPIKINPKTKISVLIKSNALVVETLVAFNPHFSKLRNPILRNLLARRVSISDACKIGGCNIDDFLDKMVEIGFELESSSALNTSENLITPKVNEMLFPDDLEVIELDVRPILAGKQDPLKLIIEKTAALKQGQCLKIINTFEPLPLINLLNKKGFHHRTERPDSETVITWFVKADTAKTDLKAIQNELTPKNTNDEFERLMQSFRPDRLHTIDVRELEMPLPMVTILENLQKLRNNEALFVYHKKVPVFLLPELKERGFQFSLQHTSHSKVNMLIYK